MINGNDIGITRLNRLIRKCRKFETVRKFLLRQSEPSEFVIVWVSDNTFETIKIDGGKFLEKYEALQILA